MGVLPTDLAPGRRPGHSAASVPGPSPSGAAPPRRLPVIGSLVGIGVGIWLSWAVCSWLHRATFNSRGFLPVVRAIATGDAALAARRCREFEDGIVPDRLLERPDLKNGLPVLTLLASVAARDETAIRAAVDRLVCRDDGGSDRTDGFPATRDGAVHPSGTLSHHPICINASCVAGDWDTAIRLSDTFLTACDAFWHRIGGVPADLGTETFDSMTAGEVRAEEQNSRLKLAWALAGSGDFARSRNELLALVDEPLPRRNPWFQYRPESLVVLAAVESRLGDAAAAKDRLEQAEHECAASPDAPVGDEFDDGPRPATVAGAYRRWRGLAVGFKPLRPAGRPGDTDASGRLWSLLENPHDFVDDYLAGAAGPSSAVGGEETTSP